MGNGERAKQLRLSRIDMVTTSLKEEDQSTVPNDDDQIVRASGVNNFDRNLDLDVISQTAVTGRRLDAHLASLANANIEGRTSFPKKFVGFPSQIASEKQDINQQDQDQNQQQKEEQQQEQEQE